MGFGLSKNFTKAVNVAFFKNIDEKSKDALYKRLTMENPSTSEIETYEWMKDLPGMSEWLDDRNIKALEKADYAIKNRDWESTIGFKRNQLDDNPAIVKARLPMLADEVVDHPSDLLMELIVAGETGLCYDGQPFFDDTHPYLDENEVEATFDNLVSGTGTTVAQIQADFATGLALFQGYKKRSGKPVLPVIDEITILHSPALNTNMREAFNADMISSTTNVFKGLGKPISTGYLSGNDWYMLILTKAMKPFVFQNRKALNTEWSEEGDFLKKRIYFGVDARYNVGYGFPQLAIKIDN